MSFLHKQPVGLFLMGGHTLIHRDGQQGSNSQYPCALYELNPTNFCSVYLDYLLQ